MSSVIALLCFLEASFRVVGSDVILKSISFDSIDSTINDWGIPFPEEKPVVDKTFYERRIHGPCSSQWDMNEKPMSDLLKTATVIYSPDTPSYDEFKSTDWVPENKNQFSPGSPWGPNYDFHSTKKKSMMASTCQIKEQDKSQWEVTRIGPMRTRGNYDWVQIGWDDIWGLSSILPNHPNGIYMIQQIMTPVLKNGTRLSNPPIHTHHIHVGPDPYVRQRLNPLSCAIRGVGCFIPHRILETHGDYVCTAEDGGDDCHLEPFPTG